MTRYFLEVWDGREYRFEREVSLNEAEVIRFAGTAQLGQSRLVCDRGDIREAWLLR